MNSSKPRHQITYKTGSGQIVIDGRTHNPTPASRDRLDAILNRKWIAGLSSVQVHGGGFTVKTYEPRKPY